MDIASINKSSIMDHFDHDIDPSRNEARQAESNASLDISLAKAHEADRDYSTTVMHNIYSGKGTLIDERA